MILEQDVLEAIAECQGERDPDARTCIKLASYYTILDHIRSKNESVVDYIPDYSRAEPPAQVRYDSGSEFCSAMQGKSLDDIMPVLDEMMDAVQVLIPKLYRATIEKIKS